MLCTHRKYQILVRNRDILSRKGKNAFAVCNAEAKAPSVRKESYSWILLAQARGDSCVQVHGAGVSPFSGYFAIPVLDKKRKSVSFGQKSCFGQSC